MNSGDHNPVALRSEYSDRNPRLRRPSFTTAVTGGSHKVSAILGVAGSFGIESAVKRAEKREFSVIVERDEDGMYVASVPALPGCHTQGKALDKLKERIREAIELCLEVGGNVNGQAEFVGVQRIAV